MKREEITKIEEICAYVVNYAQKHRMSEDDDFVQELVVRVLDDKSNITLAHKCWYHSKAILHERESLRCKEELVGLFSENIDICSNHFQQMQNDDINKYAKEKMLEMYKEYLTRYKYPQSSISLKLAIINGKLEGKSYYLITAEVGVSKVAINNNWQKFLSWARRIQSRNDMFTLDTEPSVWIQRDNGGGRKW